MLQLVYGMIPGILLLLLPPLGALPGALPAGGITGLPPDGVVTFPTAPAPPPGPVALDPGTGFGDAVC